MNVVRKIEPTAFSSIEPARELGAYEALWLEKNASFKKLADRFRADPTALPSDFVPPERSYECAHEVFRLLREANVRQFGIRINHAGEYPPKLRDARHPIEMLYFQGAWELTETRCIAVVGSREATDLGKQRAAKIAKILVREGVTVVSGLAKGIDQVALDTAIKAGGKAVGVIGTPLGTYYPRENAELQDMIARDHLLISQVPFLRYHQQDYRLNRTFFPERNATMSALTDATIIVEASDTSGTLTQARAALYQGRKLLILESCFQRTDISWPARFEQLGAIRIKDPEDIWAALG
jgi:DNA processing protein